MGCNKTTSIITTGVNTISIHASRVGCNDSVSLLYRLSVLQFQFMRPAMGATVRFRYCLTIYTRFCIYILLFIQSYLIIASILLYLILGNVRKKVFRYSSGLFNMIFHIVFISLQIRTFCFARVIAV